MPNERCGPLVLLMWILGNLLRALGGSWVSSGLFPFGGSCDDVEPAQLQGRKPALKLYLNTKHSV